MKTLKLVFQKFISYPVFQRFLPPGFCVLLFLLSVNFMYGQAADSIYAKNIKTVLLFNAGKQLTIPVINLNSPGQMELHFDDMDGDVKYYYYTYQLCNADWTPADLGQYDYLKGFTQNRITNYKFSSYALTRYTHYYASLPEGGMYPTKSGNYLLKVFVNGDPSNLVFTKRLMVLDDKVNIVAKVTKPLMPQYFNTHQKIQFTIDAKALAGINASQQIKVVVLQNYRWDNAMVNLRPTFVRGAMLEYNSENTAVFPAGKEWRWLDLRDFHLQTDRVASADYKKSYTDIVLRPDIPLAKLQYVYYKDLNGMASIEAVRGINPYWQGDYATVYFSYAPPNGEAYPNKDLYLFGQLTNYSYTDSIKMSFNADKKLYETHLFLKQGYYDYTYESTDKNNPAVHEELDGNYFETENLYTILVYYKPFIGRYDELIGMATIDSRSDQPGLSF